MSLLVLDDQLDEQQVLPPILKWASARYLRELRPGEQILDDRVPEILLQQRQPTFVTIDDGFWDRDLRHPAYCILYFVLTDREQRLLPELLRALLHRAEFRSRARRMGKVARVARRQIEWWELQSKTLRQVAWSGARQKG